MPTETWHLGCIPQVRREQGPKVDPKDGQVLFNGDGSPKTEEHTIVALLDPVTGNRTCFRMNDEGRQELIAALTGGITVPSVDASKIEIAR